MGESWLWTHTSHSTLANSHRSPVKSHFNHSFVHCRQVPLKKIRMTFGLLSGTVVTYFGVSHISSQARVTHTPTAWNGTPPGRPGDPEPLSLPADLRESGFGLVPSLLAHTFVHSNFGSLRHRAHNNLCQPLFLSHTEF